MKKSTVLIVIITFVLSVVIVGIFGMQMMSYDTKIYVQRLTPTQLITSTGETAEIRKTKNASGEEIEGDYYARITFKEDIVVNIDYELTPADATDKNVTVTIIDNVSEDVVTLNGMNIIVHEYISSIRLVYRSTDGNGKEFLFRLSFKRPTA